MGFSSLFEGEKEDLKLDVGALVNSSWELLQSYRKCAKTVEDCETQRKSLESEVTHLRSMVARQKESLEAKKRLVQTTAERERQTQLLLEEERESLNSCHEEVRTSHFQGCQTLLSVV